MKDLTNFKKLDEKKQVEVIEAYIKSLPEAEQEKARKEILG